MYLVVIALIGVFPQHSCSLTRAGPLPKPGRRPILTRGSKHDPQRRHTGDRGAEWIFFALALNLTSQNWSDHLCGALV